MIKETENVQKELLKTTREINLERITNLEDSVKKIEDNQTKILTLLEKMDSRLERFEESKKKEETEDSISVSLASQSQGQ